MNNSESRGYHRSQETLDSSPVPLNWETIHKGMVERDFAEEVPVFWDGVDEFVHPSDVFIRAWDQLRKFSYTDLLNLEQRLSNRTDETRDAIYRKGGDFQISVEKLPADNEKESPVMSDYQRVFEEKAQQQGEEGLLWLYRAYTFYYRRAQAAGALVRYIEEKGFPPKWEELTGKNRNRIIEAQGQIQPRHRMRVKAVLQNLDPDSTAREMYEAAKDDLIDQHDPVDTSQIRKMIKRALENNHGFEDRLDRHALCKYVPKEAERINIEVEKHIPPEAKEFAK